MLKDLELAHQSIINDLSETLTISITQELQQQFEKDRESLLESN